MRRIDWEEIGKGAYYAYRLKIQRNTNPHVGPKLPLWQDLSDCEQAAWILGARAGIKVFEIQKRNAESE